MWQFQKNLAALKSRASGQVVQGVSGVGQERQLIVDPEAERLDKLHNYYDHFEVETRYSITFQEFVRKIDNNTWDAYLANL